MSEFGGVSAQVLANPETWVFACVAFLAGGTLAYVMQKIFGCIKLRIICLAVAVMLIAIMDGLVIYVGQSNGLTAFEALSFSYSAPGSWIGKPLICSFGLMAAFLVWRSMRAKRTASSR